MRVTLFLCFFMVSTGCFAGVLDDLILSKNEYDSHSQIEGYNSLYVRGGGASRITMKENSTLNVENTSTPLVNHISGVYEIFMNNNSHLIYSKGVTNSIYAIQDATAYINGGQINLIKTAQYASTGKTITIDCMPNSWSWLYDGEDIIGITGQWYKHSNDEFTINFLDADRPLIPDTWTHVKVVTPEPTALALLSLGGLLLKRNR